MSSSTPLTYDVVVVGSGAGGLSTAIAAAHGGASVLVVEKADTCGGATAWSGGWMWTPRNMFAIADGVVEDRSAPRTYLENRLGDNFDAAKVDALLDGAPEMVEFFERKTALKFVPGAKIADIHGDTPGAGTGHRSVGPKPVSLRKLGPDVAALLRRQLYETSFLGMGIMAGPDLQAFLHSTRSPKAFVHCGVRVTKHMFDLATKRRGQQLVNGTALVGMMLRSALDLGVEIRVKTSATSLQTDDDGRVVGVRLEGPDGAYSVTATRGVVLATGASPRTSTADVNCSPVPPPETSTGHSLRRQPPATASPSANPWVVASTALLPPPSRTAPSPSFVIATARKGCSRTSSTAESPVSSEFSRTASVLSTRHSATTTTHSRWSSRFLRAKKCARG